MAEAGKTPLFFAADGRLIGMIAVADTVKPTSRQAVADLRAMGIEVVMLTATTPKQPRPSAARSGLTGLSPRCCPRIRSARSAPCRPRGKKSGHGRRRHQRCAALARADVGIAIGAGTDVAMESADIVLMRNDLLDVAGAIELSKATIRNIKQNLFWAFFYNVIGIPIAAGCWYAAFGLRMNPMIAALAMSFSSVFVVSNALRLRFFQAPARFIGGGFARRRPNPRRAGRNRRHGPQRPPQTPTPRKRRKPV